MKIFQYFAFLILVPLSCHARLGETIEQCHERYGEPKANETEESGRAKHEVFVIGDFEVNIFYLDRKSVYIQYRKTNGKMSLEETLNILNEKEADGQHWGKAFLIRLNLPNSETAAPELHECTRWERTDGVSAVFDETSSTSDLVLHSTNSEESSLAISIIKNARPATATKGL